MIRWTDRQVDDSKVSILPKPLFLKASWLFDGQFAVRRHRERGDVGRFLLITVTATKKYPEM